MASVASSSDANYARLLEQGLLEPVQHDVKVSLLRVVPGSVVGVCCLVGLFVCSLQVQHTAIAPTDLWNSPSQAPPLFRITAKSPYDAGLQHGHLAQDRIQAWFASVEMQSVFAFVAGKGREAFAQLKHDNTMEFPSYVAEMHGIADGAGVSVDQVWCANMMNDLENLMEIEGVQANRVPAKKARMPSQQKGCSDEYVMSRDGFAHGHNDDWSEIARQFWYFLAISPAIGASDVDSCAGVAYPASLIGWSPSWNQHGMYHTQNTLLPRKSRAGGLACSFVQKRAVCQSKNMNEYVAALTKPGWSDGASMNVVDLHNKKMVNVEIWEDRHNVQEVTNAMGNYSHFNEYKHLKTVVNSPVDNPSRFVHDPRQAEVDSLPAPRNTLDIMERLSNPLVYNKAGTLVTLVLNGTTGRLHIWCCGVSAMEAPQNPVYSWDLKSFF